MHNKLITIGNITIYGYGLMLMLGMFIATATTLYTTKKRGLNQTNVIDIICISAFTGIIGAKLLFCIINIKDVMAKPSIIFANGGFVVYGGIILAILSCFVYSKITNINFLEYSDVILPNVFIAQGIGRIGCFLAGCCYGMEYDGIGHIVFTGSEMAPNFIPLFPTQLTSSAFDIMMGIILIIVVLKKKPSKGITTSLYLLIYGIGRFLIEFVRGDIARGMIFGISTSQFISIFIILSGIVVCLQSRKLRSKN